MAEAVGGRACQQEPTGEPVGHAGAGVALQTVDTVEKIQQAEHGEEQDRQAGEEERVHVHDGNVAHFLYSNCLVKARLFASFSEESDFNH